MGSPSSSCASSSRSTGTVGRPVVRPRTAASSCSASSSSPSQSRSRSRADTSAAEAARAASIAIGPVPTGGSTDAQLAATAARSYLDQAGATGTVIITGPGIVEVSVTVTDSTPMLGIPVSQTRAHTAQLLVGVTSGEGLS